MRTVGGLSGAGHLRDSIKVYRCIQKLEEHGWLVPEAGRQVINGLPSKTYWRVVRRGAVA